MMHYLELIAVLAAGLLSGALLTEAFVLVPYWKRLPPEEFLRLHPTLAPSLFGFFAPLTIAGTLLPLVACLVLFTLARVSFWWALSGLSALAILGLYFAFFRGANLQFAQTKDASRAATTLGTWARLHNLRTVIAILGFASATLGFRG